MRTPPSQLSRHRGFTLGEILVVLGITIVLVALLSPALTKARSSADGATALSNLRQIVTSLRLYANDNNGYLPSRTFKGQDASGNEADYVDECLIFAPLVSQGYIDNPKVFINPINARKSKPLGQNTFGLGNHCYFGSNTYVCADFWVSGEGFPATAVKLLDDGNIPVVWDQRADQFWEGNQVKGPQGQPAGNFAYLDGSAKLLWKPMSLLKTGGKP